MTSSTLIKNNLKPPFLWNEIRPYLLNLDTLVPLLKTLYEGNGWIASLHHIKGEAHTDLLLSYPSNPTQVAIIINIVNDENPLNFTETRGILKQLETIKSETYNCNQYAIFSLSGFDAKCSKLKAYNLLLHNTEEIKKLIRKYSDKKRNEPEIQLFAHNQNTYENVVKLFNKHNKVAVVQATGTGKSYLIAKLLSDYKNVTRLVMAPSHYIIEQIKSHIRWESDTIIFMTYAYAMYLSDDALKKLKPEFIVLDEFHRCGAEEWGSSVLEILNAYPKAKIFGTSATPIRYLDGGRDMSIEIFNGIVAENLSLTQSIVKRILPMPKYVTALYSLKEEIENLSSKIKKNNYTYIEKENLLNKLNITNINWERTKGISSILQKYILPGMNKFIVFCREGEHILEMEQVAYGWFKTSFPKTKIKTYRVISAESERNQNLKNFIKADDKNIMHLLFSIDMLNEGLHIEDVSGVILLRPTESPTIFYQQIGRCLKVGFKGQPIIFDFVNNFRSIRTNDFLSDLEYFRQEEKGMRNDLGLEEICPPFTIIDEAKEITEVFGQIRSQADNWEIMFQRLLNFKSRFGNCLVPNKWEEDKKLAQWVLTQRGERFDMLPEKREKLANEGFIWSTDDYFWNEAYQTLVAYQKLHGHCNVTKAENNNMYQWCKGQRRNYRLKKFKTARKNQLELIGFEFEPVENDWENRFFEYKLFLELGLKEKDLYKPEYSDLHKWVMLQRLRKRRNNFEILTPERIERLNNIGMSWNPDDEKWDAMYEKLIDYKNKFGNCRVPLNWKENPALGVWVTNMRGSYKRKQLSREKLDKLTAVGMEWKLKDALLEELWEQKFAELKQFYEQHGHCNVNNYNRGDLTSWLTKQRRFYKNGTLNAEHKTRLESIGIEWEVAHYYVWDRNFNLLLEFKKEFGHCNVSSNLPKKYKKLEHWVLNQRNYYKNETLAEYKIKKLDNEGFVWNFRENELDEIFENHLNELRKFKKEFGHCKVSIKNKDYKSLANYLQHQRRQYKKGVLDKTRIKILENEGFEWNLKSKIEERWYLFFEQLKQFKIKYGHCNVTDSYNLEFPKLANWVTNQRAVKKQNKMLKERKKLLDSIGFEWTLSHQDEETWNKRIKELIAFKKENGHCQVTQSYTENPLLGNWIISVRSRGRKGKLSKEKIKQLNDIGFIWSIGKGKYKRADKSED